VKTLPENVIAYKRTPEFTETTVPDGLLRGHTTKAGVWGNIVVLEGQLLYRIREPEFEEGLLDCTRAGVVEPTMRHAVEARGAVRFYVEFNREPEAS